MHQSHPFETMLQAVPNAVITQSFDKYGQGYALIPNFQIRFDPDKVEIGSASRFDKWGNSVDFVCTPVPEKQETFDALMAVLATAHQERWTSPHEFEPLDIWPHVRKQRRQMASTARLASRRELKAQRG